MRAGYASSGSSEAWDAGVLLAALEAVALAVHLQDVHVVGEPVQQRSGEAFRAEDFGPLVERQIGGHQDGAPLVALGEDLEEQFRPGAGQGHEAQLVDDQQVEAGQLPLEVEQPSLVLASISSWTRPAAVVKPTDMPL